MSRSTMRGSSSCVMAWLSVLLLTSAGRAETAGAEGRYVEINFATPGQRHQLARIDLDALPQRVTRYQDPRYDGEVRVRGLPLSDLWARVPIPAAADLAILRFDSGLQIPIAFRDGEYMTRLAAFVVRAATTDRWAALVPGQVESARRPPTDEDLRAVSFHGNRVVVSDPSLAPVLASVANDLRPWLYADSIFAIDFVERIAWEAQFDAGPATAEGKRIYLGTCRFCHGVRGAGAALGWDFVDPVPIYSQEWLKRFRAGIGEMNPMPAQTMLQIHVRFRAGVSGVRTMPALRGMKLPEVKALWAWLEAISTPSASRTEPPR